MKVNNTKNIRNVTVVSHGNAGKTTLIEAIAFKKKLISRMGKVDDGNTVSDYQPEEKERKISISLSIIPVEHKEVKINFIDTPGYADFFGEVLSGIRAGENSLILINATSGIEVQTKKQWVSLEKEMRPRAFFVNKLDIEGTDFFKIVEQIKNTFSAKAFPVVVPVMEGNVLKGVRNLLSNTTKEDNEYRKALIEIAAEGNDKLLEKYFSGEKLTPEEIKAGLKEAFIKGEFFPILAGAAINLIGIDELLDFIVDYMVSPDILGSVEGVDLKTKEEIERKISTDENFSAFIFKTLSDPYVGKLSFTKVYSGVLHSNTVVYNSSKDTSEKVSQLLFMRGSNQEPTNEIIAGDIGILTKLVSAQTNDTLSDKSAPIVYQAIRFPEPMLSKAMSPESKADEDRMSVGLSKITDEDPTVKVIKNAETKEQIIYGIGETHLSVIVEKLKKRYNVKIDLSTPKVPYRETITKKVKVEGKYKKQSGGHGQYGHCWIEVEPLERGKKFEFQSKIFGGAIPKQYIPAVEKGVYESMEQGILAGYPVVDVKVTVVDGSYHPVDSSELAFKVAGSMAFKKALEQCNSIILEPIEKLEIIVEDQYMGDVIGDLNSKRGRVLGMKAKEGKQIIEALVPLSEVLAYANDLNSITQGTGEFSMEASHYEPAPPRVVEKVIAESNRNKNE